MQKKLFIMDIDGTLAIGGSLIPGAAELIREIRCLLYTSDAADE